MLGFAINTIFLCAAILSIITIIESLRVAYLAARQLTKDFNELNFIISEHLADLLESQHTIASVQPSRHTEGQSAASRSSAVAISSLDLRQPPGFQPEYA